jgi:hypothetical protein
MELIASASSTLFDLSIQQLSTRNIAGRPPGLVLHRSDLSVAELVEPNAIYQIFKADLQVMASHVCER